MQLSLLLGNVYDGVGGDFDGDDGCGGDNDVGNGGGGGDSDVGNGDGCSDSVGVIVGDGCGRDDEDGRGSDNSDDGCDGDDGASTNNCCGGVSDDDFCGDVGNGYGHNDDDDDNNDLYCHYSGAFSIKNY